jgi:hypothetical protein
MTCALEVMKEVIASSEPADGPDLLVDKPFAFRRGRCAFGRRQTR